MRKLAFYKRKSTDVEDKQQLSLEGQGEEVSRYLALRDCEINGEKFRIVATIEESLSAKRPGRPQFNKMVEDLCAGIYDGIIAYKLDRLTRNFTDLGTLSDLVQYEGKSIILTDSGLIKNNATDLFTLGINVCVAKKKVDDLSEDTKRGMRQKAELGWFPGFAPTGYLNVRTLDKVNIIEIDHERAPYVTKAFMYYNTGLYSLETLSELLTREGLRTRNKQPLSKATLQLMLRNPFYYGYFRRNGELIEGKHKPLISKEIWDEVQERLSGRSNFALKPRTLVYEYRGFLRCAECGCMITAQKAKGVPYYRCTKARVKCSQPYIQEKELAPQLEAIFERLELTPEKALDLQRQLKKYFEDDLKYSETREKNINRLLTELKEEKKQLYRNMAVGKIPNDEEYKALQDELGQKIAAAEKDLMGIARSTSDFLQKASNLIQLCQQAKNLFRAGTADEKQQLLRFVASNLLLDRKKVLVDYKKPFDAMIKAAESFDWLRRLDSNQ